MSKERKRRRPLAGRHLVTLGALALLALSGYELWIRWEDFWAWSAGVRHLSAVRGTPFVEDLAIVFEEPRMRELGYKILFLCLSLVFALICLLRRSRARGAWIIIALDVAVAGAGAYLGLYSLQPSDWAQMLKLAPLGLILAGCVVNLLHRQARRRRRRKEGERNRDKRG